MKMETGQGGSLGEISVGAPRGTPTIDYIFNIVLMLTRSSISFDAFK